MSNKRIDYLDALRGFAILGVIFTHAASKSELGGPLRALMNLGGYGVQLFFVVSAFTILMTLVRAQETESAPTRNFFIRRLMRIVPLYWLGIVFYTAVYGIYSSHGWRAGPEAVDYLANLFLVNVMVPGADSSVVPGGWSISVEVLFYVTVPLWALFVRGMKSALLFTVLSAVIGQILLYVMADTLNSGTFNSEYWYRSYLSQVPCFGVGMVLYYAVGSELAGGTKMSLGLILLSAILFVVARQYGGDVRHLAFAVSFAVFGFALHLRPWGFAVNWVMVGIGRMSYSLYLLHFVVLDAISHGLSIRSLPVAVHFAALVVIGLPVSLFLAHFSFKYLETSLSAYARRLIGGLEARSSSRA